jgi:hypothetical protein
MNGKWEDGIGKSEVGCQVLEAWSWKMEKYVEPDRVKE